MGTFGGNLSCVEIETGNGELLLCDIGSGAREFAVSLLADRGPAPHTIHVLQSHVHWDHIMGFPFVITAYIRGNKFCIYGCHDELEEAFRRQQRTPNFPVDFDMLGADFEFTVLETDTTYDICGFRVTAKKQLHGDDSFGYRLERGGKTVIYTTDSEHKMEDRAETEGFADFFRDADLVIFDAQYSLAEQVSVKEDWGHSSNVVGVELCQLANAKHLVLFHHEPAFDDDQLLTIFQETLRFEEITRGDRPLKITSSYDGLVIDV